MDSIYAHPDTTPYPWIPAKVQAGHIPLREALEPGGALSHFLTSRVPEDLRKKAGLKKKDRAYVFTSAGLRSMPFVSLKTVLLLTEQKVSEGQSRKTYLKLVYGQCPITGVGGKNPLLHFHHITFRKRHYLVGFIYRNINTGLGALGDYKSK